MRNIFNILVLVVAFYSGSYAQNSRPLFPVKSAQIKYSVKMFGSEGTMVVNFDNFGKRQVSVLNLNLFGSPLNTKILLIDNQLYNINVNEKHYSKSTLTEKDFERMNYLINEAEITKNPNLRKEKPEILLNKNCNVYVLQQKGLETKYWVWKNLILKLQSTAQGQTISILATEITEGIQAPDVFKIPSEYKVISN